MTHEGGQLFAQLGQRLRALRIQHGYTQQQLAERCNVTAKYISELERGLRNPSLHTLHRIACAGLETTLTTLVYRVDEALLSKKGSAPSSSHTAQEYVAAQLKGKLQAAESLGDTPLAGLEVALAGRSREEQQQLVTLFQHIVAFVDKAAGKKVNTYRVRQKESR